MRIYLIICFLLSIITNGFCASDTTQTKTKKNIFSITLGAGKTVPRLTTDYEYESDLGHFQCLGFTYTRKLNSKLSFLADVSISNFWSQEINITENLNSYKEDEYAKLRINARSDISAAIGTMINFYNKKTHKNLFKTSLLAGYSRSKFGYENIQTNVLEDFRYLDYSPESVNYLFLRGVISREIKLSKKIKVSPMIGYQVALTPVSDNKILLFSKYYERVLVNYKYHSIFLGLQFDF